MIDLVGIAEIAKMFDVSSAAVTNWRKRSDNFPKPVAILKSGPVFQAEQIEKWYGRKNKMAAIIVSSINLKGGVAKTTTTVGLAQTLSGAFNKRVLVIDLDPQTNATTMLIGEEKWFSLNQAGHTISTLFEDAIDDCNNFDLSKTLQKSVGNISEVKSVDLLPSSLNLINLQDRLITMPAGKYQTRNPVNILRRGIKEITNDYDYVLIDCPPNLGYITLNGLRISDGYIIPTIPDVLSTYGIPQIVTRIAEFSDEIEDNILPIGIVATKVRGQASIHTRTLNKMRKDAGKLMGESKLRYPLVFNTIFSESARVAEAAEYEEYKTLRQKWGYQGQYDSLAEFAGEFIQITKEV
ncbi:Sporulation initiation inhibitor protein Soj [Paenibacillus nuruki]|uniref:Sporulation initiation inhibitor protein Soj n=1 Tax=Paenibacillus nuruki TaxID=1886670 RepID=A0A1E3L6A7_9BACL|nr:AAA family ATPase [Paenibacillus nuruki]ODP28510.1 Sporulation initiation inhibitor protein Soj [Paenibacillus nuruki]